MKRGKGYGRAPSQKNQSTMGSSYTGKRGSGWGRKPSQKTATAGSGAGTHVATKSPGDGKKSDSSPGPGHTTGRQRANPRNLK